MIKKLNGSSQKVRRAHLLLKADADGPAWTDAQIAETFNCRVQTLENLRKRVVTEGFDLTEAEWAASGLLMHFFSISLQSTPRLPLCENPSDSRRGFCERVCRSADSRDNWIGDPDQGFGLKQPGAWTFNILPYAEESALHSLGKGGTKEEKIAAGQKQMQTPLPFLNCPSRRQPILYPARNDNKTSYNNPAIPRPNLVAKTCYAKNGGNEWHGFVAGPTSIAGAKTFAFPPLSKSTGVDWWYMTFKPAHIRDGTSKTFFYGEKHINFQFYDSWQGGGDASTMYEGFDLEATRYAGTTYPLIEDTIEGIDQFQDTPQFKSFGGPHAGIVQFAFCDGSVKQVRVTIDPETLRRLANRHDGLEINEEY